MDPRQPFDRPNTLGQSWRRMSQPRPRQMNNPPPQPEWPQLPDDGLRGRWPPANADSAMSGEPNATDPRQRATGGEGDRSPRQRWPTRYGRDVLDRWRGASTRTKLGIGGIAMFTILTIVACCSLTQFVLGAVQGSGSAPQFGAFATQQTTGQGGTSSKNPTATITPNNTATSANTSTATQTPSTPLTITFTCASGSIRGTGKVCVQTAPSAILSLSVRYCDGTTAKGLHSAGIANASGDFTWTWSVHMTCVGQATATVTAKQNGTTVTATKTFNITA